MHKASYLPSFQHQIPDMQNGRNHSYLEKKFWGWAVVACKAPDVHRVLCDSNTMMVIKGSSGKIPQLLENWRMIVPVKGVVLKMSLFQQHQCHPDLVRNGNYQAPSLACWSQHCGVGSRWFWCPPASKDHCLWGGSTWNVKALGFCTVTSHSIPGAALKSSAHLVVPWGREGPDSPEVFPVVPEKERNSSSPELLFGVSHSWLLMITELIGTQKNWRTMWPRVNSGKCNLVGSF